MLHLFVTCGVRVRERGEIILNPGEYQQIYLDTGLSINLDTSPCTSLVAGPSLPLCIYLISTLYSGFQVQFPLSKASVSSSSLLILFVFFLLLF